MRDCRINPLRQRLICDSTFYF